MNEGEYGFSPDFLRSMYINTSAGLPQVDEFRSGESVNCTLKEVPVKNDLNFGGIGKLGRESVCCT